VIESVERSVWFADCIYVGMKRITNTPKFGKCYHCDTVGISLIVGNILMCEPCIRACDEEKPVNPAGIQKRRELAAQKQNSN